MTRNEAQKIAEKRWGPSARAYISGEPAVACCGMGLNFGFGETFEAAFENADKRGRHQCFCEKSVFLEFPDLSPVSDRSRDID